MGKDTPGCNRKHRNHVTLRYPQHCFKPEDLLDFVELPPFTRRWEKLGLDCEDDLTALQLMIMLNPKSASPIEGTRGIRKLRYAPSRWNVGKSGAARVLYVHFEEYGIVWLLLVYGKNEVGNISEGVKKHLNSLIDEIERNLRRRNSL